MIEREFNYINGNTAVQPERKVRREDRDSKYNDYLKEKLKRQKIKKIEKAKRGVAMIQIALATFVLGSIIIYRYDSLYSLKRDLTNVNSQMKLLNAENEAIKVDLLKNSSLKSIEENAKKKVKMIEGKEATKINVDFTTNHLGELMNNK